jgi:phosphoglycerate dehydrogenase-like enzyme
MKIVLFQQHKFELWNPPPWVAQRLRERFPQLDVVHPASVDALTPAFAHAEVAIGSNLPLDKLACASQLKWVHSPAAAVHHYMVPEFIASSITLTNGRSTFAAPVAEHVMGQILALARQIPVCVRLQMKQTWGQQLLWDARPRPRELKGATLGLVGLGAIGIEVVPRAKAFGMNVVAVREHPEKPADSVGRVYGPQELERLLAQSDFVLLAAPVTPNTRHLISAERLARMKPGAYLINVGRGALIDESALINALQTKQIAGAALDVFEEEPLPEASPLWALENLLITPHCAGFIENLWERHLELIIENLRRYLGGMPLLGLVDKASGY